jgi:hypothetical protein
MPPVNSCLLMRNFVLLGPRIRNIDIKISWFHRDLSPGELAIRYVFTAECAFQLGTVGFQECNLVNIFIGE